MRNKAWLLLLLAVALMFAACGGGGGGSDSDDDSDSGTEAASVDGKWVVPSVTFTNSTATSWSETFTNFTVVIDGDEIGAYANDEYWNWGPASYTRTGNRVVAVEIPEQEGGDTVKLSIDLSLETETTMTGTLHIDWWDSANSRYFPGSAEVTLTK